MLLMSAAVFPMTAMIGLAPAIGRLLLLAVAFAAAGPSGARADVIGDDRPSCRPIVSAISTPAQDRARYLPHSRHIVLWGAAWRVTQLLERSTVRFVLASSGHIAGIINPPDGKGTYWVNEAGKPCATAQAWRETATARGGNWWTDWTAWLAERSGRKGTPPTLGSAAHPPIADAPGTYVLEK